MLKKKLFSSKAFKDSNGQNITINYFITEGYDFLSDTSSKYGIAIEKLPEYDSLDNYVASCCFKDKSNAKVLLSKLKEFSVTPVLAEETMDAVLDCCEFNY